MKLFARCRREVCFTAAVLALAALLFALTHRPGAGAVAVLRYGTPQQEMRIALDKDARYDIDTGRYTIHLQVQGGGIAFVQSPCPDHLCEGFGTLRRPGDWAACLPAQATITIE